MSKDQQTRTVSALVVATLEHSEDITVTVPAAYSERQIWQRLEKKAAQVITDYTCVFENISPDIVDTVIIPHDGDVELLITDEFLYLLPMVHRCWEYCLRSLDHPSDHLPYLKRVTDALASHLSEQERQVLFKIMYRVFAIDEAEQQA
jgi:hypothetical protein